MQLDKRLRFKRDKDYKWISSFFIKLYISIQYLKIDRKDIANMLKLSKEFIFYLIVCDGSSCNIQQDHIWLERYESDEKAP